MKPLLSLVLPLSLVACTSVSQVPPEPMVTPLMSRPIAEMLGKEGLILQVEYGPGAADPVHRHNAHAFVYVLEGSVVMQVAGGEETVLTQGQTFYEGPDDLHVVGRNASNLKPAKFVVFLIKDIGAPALIPELGPGASSVPMHHPN